MSQARKKKKLSYPTFTLRCSPQTRQFRPRVMRGKGYAEATSCGARTDELGLGPIGVCLLLVQVVPVVEPKMLSGAERRGVGSSYSVEMDICVPFSCSAPSAEFCIKKGTPKSTTIGNVCKKTTKYP